MEKGKIEIANVPNGNVLVYEFGARVDKEAADLAFGQIVKARRLYNDIVACMRDIVAEMQEFTLEAAGVEARALDARIKVLNADFDAARAANDEDAMKVIAGERRSLWPQLGALLTKTRKEHRAEVQKRFFARIGRNSSCDTYVLRSKAVADGLGWATANATLDAALLAFKKTIAKGQAPRFAAAADSDQDSLTLQFTAAGGVAADVLLAGNHGELSLLPTNGCGRRKYGEFRFRLGPAAAQQYATGTWQYHRPIPQGASIALARLIRRRIGKDIRWHIQILVKLREPVRVAVSHERKPLATVHFGWSGDVSGRRVAGIADSADPGAAKVVQLPPEIESQLARSAELQSLRDKARDEIVPVLKELKNVPGTAQEMHAELRRLPASRIAINRIHRFVRLLRDSGYDHAELMSWRLKDRSLWQASAHIARRTRFMRRDFYRNLALGLARQYEVVAIEPLDLASAAKVIDESSGERTEFAKKARAGRVVAAIYELEAAIRWACVKTGAAVLEITSKTASICSICGEAVQSDTKDSQILHCDSCGAELDRKQNGAATAWQQADKVRESLAEDFHLEVARSRRAQAEEKTERLSKMAAARKKARTTSDEESA